MTVASSTGRSTAWSGFVLTLKRAWFGRDQRGERITASASTRTTDDATARLNAALLKGEEPGMTAHLNLLVEQAEEALRQAQSFREQRDKLTEQIAEVRPQTVWRSLTRLARRRLKG